CRTYRPWSDRIAVSAETALHRGSSRSGSPRDRRRSRSPQRPPFIEAGVGASSSQISGRSRSPQRPPFIEALPSVALASLADSDRGLRRDRPSSRRALGDVQHHTAVIAVSAETALHRGCPARPVPPNPDIAVSAETALHRGPRGRLPPLGWGVASRS